MCFGSVCTKIFYCYGCPAEYGQSSYIILYFSHGLITKAQFCTFTFRTLQWPSQSNFGKIININFVH